MRGLILVIFIIVTPLDAQIFDESTDVRIGLTLSAGGALGLAHIGVLKVLEREEIPISCISSNSMGAIVGGLYAAGFNAAQIESIAVNMDWHELFNPSLDYSTHYIPKSQQTHRYIFKWTHDRFSPSIPSELISLQKAEFTLMRLLSEIQYNTHYSFDSLKIPLRIIAVDIVSGHRVIMKRGRLDKAIRGSIAIPGIFAPQANAEQILVDGGVLQYFPVDPLNEFDPDLIIASLTLNFDTTAGVSVIDVVTRTTSMVGFEDIQRQKDMADIVIEPDLSAFHAQDYSRAREIIEAGEIAAEKALPVLHELLSGRKPVAHHKEITERNVPYVRSVRFEGLEETRERTVKKETSTTPGMLLCFDRLIDDMEGLYHTGLFNSVNYRLESPTQDSVDIVFEVQEKSYGFYLLGIRYDNMNNATLGLEIGQSNLFGTGLCLRTALTLGDPNEYRLGLTDTRILTLPLGYRIDFFWNSIDRSYFENHIWQADYNTDTRGAMGEIGYFVSRKSYFSLDFRAFQALYRLPELAFFDTLPKAEWIVGPGYNLEFNNHDDIYFPQSGANYKMNVFYAFTKLGASNNCLKLEVNLDQYIPVTSSFLVHAGLDFAVSSGDLAWAEYFYTGGPNFMGFMLEEFTTTDKAVLRLGFEVKLFSILGQNNPIYLQLLSNIASFDPHADLLELNNRSLCDFELGIGAGLRTNTPIGPLQIAVGAGNPHRTPREDHIQFIVYLSLGRDFRYTK